MQAEPPTILPTIFSCVAGVLFGGAWLVWIDGVATSEAPFDLQQLWPGLLTTLGLIALNMVSWDFVGGGGYASFDADDSGNMLIARLWVFVSLLMCFAGLIWSLLTFFLDPSFSASAACGAWQCGLLFASAILFRAARTKVES